MRLAMKFGVSLARTTPLPSWRSQKSESVLQNFGRSFRAGDDFDEFHVARRIEKVRAGPVLLELFRQTFGDEVNGQAGGVGGDDGTGLAELCDFGEQAAFDFQIFGDDLDDPVGVGDARKIVFKIADGNFGSESGREKCGGLGFFGGVEAGEHDFVAVGGSGVFRNDVEQQAGEAGVGKMSGDACAHGAGAENDCFLDAMSHELTLRSGNRTAEQVTKWEATGQTGVW